MSIRLAPTMLCWLALLPMAAARAANPATLESLRPAREAYLACATLALPDLPSRIANVRLAATVAVDRCHTEKLALVGQFALDNPGAKNARELAEKVRQQTIDDLSSWIFDMEAMFIDRQR